MSLTLPSFTEIDLDINADLSIKQGKTQSIEITGPQELIDLLNKEVSNDKWSIKYTKRRVNSTKSLEIKITLAHLEEIELNGSGNIDGETDFHEKKMEIDVNGSGNITMEVYLEDLEIGINGSGNVYLNGSTEELEADINGSGDINCKELIVENVEISINGSGDANIHVTKKLSASINGSGDVKYLGSPELKLRKNGSGDLKSLKSN
jgi:hypothetical protein